MKGGWKHYGVKSSNQHLYVWWSNGYKRILRTSYSLSKKTASGLGVVRAVHQGAKDYGFKNIAKAQMKTAFTGDYAKGNTKATAKINQWFNDK